MNQRSTRQISSSPPRPLQYSVYDEIPDSPPSSYNRSRTPTRDIDTSIAEKLTSERRRNYQSIRQPLSSPLRTKTDLGSRPSPRQCRQNEQRHQQLQNRAVKARGGVLKMEKDVMDLEKGSELRLLAQEANLHHLDPDEAAELELEQEELEEEELIALLNERDEYERLLELEQQQIEDALAHFSISEPS